MLSTLSGQSNRPVRPAEPGLGARRGEVALRQGGGGPDILAINTVGRGGAWPAGGDVAAAFQRGHQRPK